MVRHLVRTDDWLYRLLTFVQMGGVLVLAAGIQPAFADRDYTVLILSYVVMRIAMVAQWLRASRSAGLGRRAIQLYASGIAIQVLLLLRLTLSGPVAAAALIVLIAAELAVPIIVGNHGMTPWHPHHTTERYGLFTLIVLGECVVASANAVIEALHANQALGPLISTSVLTLVVTAALWWIYFWPPHHEAISSFASSLRQRHGVDGPRRTRLRAAQGQAGQSTLDPHPPHRRVRPPPRPHGASPRGDRPPYRLLMTCSRRVSSSPRNGAR